MPVAKKIVTWLLLLGAIFFTLADPQGAAEIVRDAAGALRDAGEAIATFFRALAG